MHQAEVGSKSPEKGGEVWEENRRLEAELAAVREGMAKVEAEAVEFRLARAMQPRHPNQADQVAALTTEVAGLKAQLAEAESYAGIDLSPSGDGEESEQAAGASPGSSDSGGGGAGPPPGRAAPPVTLAAAAGAISKTLERVSAVASAVAGDLDPDDLARVEADRAESTSQTVATALQVYEEAASALVGSQSARLDAMLTRLEGLASSTAALVAAGGREY